MLNGYPLDSAPLNVGSASNVVELSVNATARATAASVTLRRITPVVPAAATARATVAPVAAPLITKQLSVNARATATAFTSLDVNLIESLDAIATATATVATVTMATQVALSANATATAITGKPPELGVIKKLVPFSANAMALIPPPTLDCLVSLSNTAYYYIHGVPFPLWKTMATATVAPVTLDNLVKFSVNATALARVRRSEEPMLNNAAAMLVFKDTITATATAAAVSLGVKRSMAAAASAAVAVAQDPTLTSVRRFSADATATATVIPPALFVNVDADAPDERTLFVEGNLRQVILDKSEREIHVQPVQ